MACLARAWTTVRSPLASVSAWRPALAPAGWPRGTGRGRGQARGRARGHTPWAAPARTEADGAARVVSRPASGPRGRGPLGGASRAGGPSLMRPTMGITTLCPPPGVAKANLEAPALRDLARGIKAGPGMAASCPRGKSEAGLAAYQGRTWEGGPHHLAWPLRAGWVLARGTPRSAVAARLAPATRARRAPAGSGGRGLPAASPISGGQGSVHECATSWPDSTTIAPARVCRQGSYVETCHSRSGAHV